MYEVRTFLRVYLHVRGYVIRVYVHVRTRVSICVCVGGHP